MPVDPSLKAAANQAANNPTFDSRPVDPFPAVPDDPRNKRMSPTQDGYWDPSSGRYEYLGGVDPGQDSGKYALHNALNDASSSASNMYYYGGSGDFAQQQSDYYANLGNNLATRLGPQADFASGPASYDKMVSQQQALANQLGNIAAGRVVTPAEKQMMAATSATQSGLRSQLASTQGGLLAAASANAATKYATDAAASSGERNARMLRIAQANAAQDQLAGLTGAMRSQESSRAQDVARLQNANNIRNANSQAEAYQMSLGALQRGLEGNIARQQARMDTYNTAVGNAGKYDKFNQDIADKNTNTFIGAVQSGFDAAGKMYTGMKSNNTSDNNKKDGTK